jgi:hypothetical protein
MHVSDTKLALQADTTSDVKKAMATARIFISHFIQVFNLGVTRAVYSAGQRAYFHLDVISEALPELTKESDISTWGDNIVDGDLARVAAGGAAMSNPTALQVKAAVLDFNTKNTDQSGKKDAFDTSQEDIIALVPEAEKVVKKVWDEVETFYNEETPSSMRRKSREWGVVYISDTELTFNFTVKDSVSNAAIEAASILLDQTGNEVLTDINGTAIMKSKIADHATFIISQAGYVSQTIELDLPLGTTVFTEDVALVHV